MERKNLEVVSTRTAKTLKQIINGREVFYQYETADQNPNPTAVNFSTQGQDGKALGGSYSANGGININGNNITQTEDLEIVKIAFETILEIINHKND